MVGDSWDTWVTGQTMQFGYGFYDPPSPHTHPEACGLKINPCCGVGRRWRQSATLFTGGTSIKGL